MWLRMRHIHGVRTFARIWSNDHANVHHFAGEDTGEHQNKNQRNRERIEPKFRLMY
jgi:hypothetical protein